MLGIEFDEIAYAGHHARFFGSLIQLDPEPPGFQCFLGSDRTENGVRFPNGQGVTSVIVQKSVHIQNAPGVGTFFLLGSTFRIPKGTVMVWDTQPL